jgi:[ribosomal protein S5]-alanine N-acetyltransferase
VTDHAYSRSVSRSVSGPILETERLRIRPFHEDLSDAGAMFSVLSDPVSMRFYPKPFDADGALAWVERWVNAYDEAGFGLLAIEDRMTGEVIGDCGPTLQNVDGQSFVELGWHVRRDRQGAGIATEAAVACRDDVWGRLDVERLISLIRPENVPSWSVARKLGFSPWRATVRGGMAHTVWTMTRPRR